MKNRLVGGFTIGFLIAAAVTAYAAKNTDLTHIFGVSGQDSELRLSGGDAVIDYDQASSKLRFSNNGGVDFKNLGSGGGGEGGLNVLSDDNADFESGTPPSSWTASGGTFQAETGDPLFGAQSGYWDSDASAQTLSSAAKNMANYVGIQSNECIALVKYAYPLGSAGDYSIQAYDGTNVLVNEPLSLTTSGSQEGLAVFTCPDSGTIALRIVSQVADAEPIVIDDAYLGSNIKSVQVGSAELIASAFYAPTANCQWDRTNTALGAFPTDADCPAITVEQSKYTVTTTDNDLPDIVFPSLPPGDYLVEMIGTAVQSSPGAGISYAISDGTDTRGTVSINPNDGSARSPLVVKAWFSYSTSGARTFSAFGAATAGSAGIFLSQALETLHFKVTRFPLSSQSSISFDQASWRIDANISGANIDLGTGAQSSYVGMTNSGLTLTQNAGSAPVQIGCSSTNGPTGTTCALGDESNAIAFTPPYAGQYLACVSFTHRFATDGSGALDATFQITETATNAQTVLQEGKSRIMSGGGNSESNSLPHRLCGTFTFNSANQKMLRLMYEQGVGATITANEVIGDAAASSGQRDIHWEVYPLTRFMGGIRFDNVPSTPATSTERIVRANLASPSGGSCAVTSESGDWVNGTPSSSGTGICTVPITSGVFSGTPSCAVTPFVPGVISMCVIQGTPSATSIEYACFNDSGAAVNVPTSMVCMGPR